MERKEKQRRKSVGKTENEQVIRKQYRGREKKEEEERAERKSAERRRGKRSR